MKSRREARSGYVTLEGFWEDPPGYVENIVWPNYVKDHAFLFVDGDVEGELDDRMVDEMRLHAMPPRAEQSMTACLHWACGEVAAAIREVQDPGQVDADEKFESMQIS